MKIYFKMASYEKHDFKNGSAIILDPIRLYSGGKRRIVFEDEGRGITQMSVIERYVLFNIYKKNLKKSYFNFYKLSFFKLTKYKL